MSRRRVGSKFKSVFRPRKKGRTSSERLVPPFGERNFSPSASNKKPFRRQQTLADANGAGKQQPTAVEDRKLPSPPSPPRRESHCDNPPAFSIGCLRSKKGQGSEARRAPRPLPRPRLLPCAGLREAAACAHTQRTEEAAGRRTDGRRETT